MSRELLKRALSAIRSVRGFPSGMAIDTIRAIEAELNKPEPEPVAWRALNFSEHGGIYAYRDIDEPFIGVNGSNVGEPLYTTPPDQSARIAEQKCHPDYHRVLMGCKSDQSARIAEQIAQRTLQESSIKDQSAQIAALKHELQQADEDYVAVEEAYLQCQKDLYDETEKLAALQDKRERLSDSKIIEIMGNRFPVETIAFYEGFRAAEEAHGIGE